MNELPTPDEIIAPDPQEQPGWADLSVEERGRAKAAWLNKQGKDVCPVCLAPRSEGVCGWCPKSEARAADAPAVPGINTRADLDLWLDGYNTGTASVLRTLAVVPADKLPAVVASLNAAPSGPNQEGTPL